MAVINVIIQLLYQNKSQLGLGSSYNNLILNYLDTQMFGRNQYIDNNICPKK